MKLNKKNIIGNIIFLIGLPGSGKTTIAKKIKSTLILNDISCLHLDGDELREALNNNKYSIKERIKLSLTYLRLAEMLLKQTNVVLISSVSMYSQVEKIFTMKPNIKTYLIEKNFKDKDKIKKKIRMKYMNNIKFDVPKKINKKILNKSVLKSSKDILNDFR